MLAPRVDVLADAGLVRRVRPEGDRRRSYLTPVPGTLDGLTGQLVVHAELIVFVGTENAARSQLAAALRSARSPVSGGSEGTHQTRRVHSGAIATARRHGIRGHR